MRKTKEFWKSKTVVFNALVLVVALAAAFGFGDFQPTTEIKEIAAVIVTIVNLFLRFKTDTKVSILPVE